MTLTDSESLILVIPALNFLLGTSITSMPMSAIRMTARSKRADKLERKEAASECILLLSICVIREQLLLSWRRLVSLGTLRGAQVLQGLTSESSPAGSHVTTACRQGSDWRGVREETKQVLRLPTQQRAPALPIHFRGGGSGLRS